MRPTRPDYSYFQTCNTPSCSLPLALWKVSRTMCGNAKQSSSQMSRFHEWLSRVSCCGEPVGTEFSPLCDSYPCTPTAAKECGSSPTFVCRILADTVDCAGTVQARFCSGRLPSMRKPHLNNSQQLSRAGKDAVRCSSFDNDGHMACST